MVKRRKVDRRMVVISLDAVGARDLAYLKTAASWCCQQSAAAARQKEPGLDVAEAFYPWEDFI